MADWLSGQAEYARGFEICYPQYFLTFKFIVCDNYAFVYWGRSKTAKTGFVVMYIFM